MQITEQHRSAIIVVGLKIPFSPNVLLQENELNGHLLPHLSVIPVCSPHKAWHITAIPLRFDAAGSFWQGCL